MKNICIAMLALCGIALTSCSDDDPVGPVTEEAVLSVMVDADCGAEASNIRIYVDDIYLGMTQPGSTGLSKRMAVGNHTIRARSDEGVEWPSFSQYLPKNGLMQNLSCH